MYVTNLNTINVNNLCSMWSMHNNQVFTWALCTTNALFF